MRNTLIVGISLVFALIRLADAKPPLYPSDYVHPIVMAIKHDLENAGRYVGENIPYPFEISYVTDREHLKALPTRLEKTAYQKERSALAFEQFTNWARQNKVEYEIKKELWLVLGVYLRLTDLNRLLLAIEAGELGELLPDASLPTGYFELSPESGNRCSGGFFSEE